MNYSLAQILFVARNGDFGPLVNILVVVLIAVFWGISTIIRKTQKFEGEDDADATQERGPQQRPAGPAQRGPQRPGVQPPGTKIVPPQPMAEKPTAQRQQPTQMPTLDVIEESKLAELGPQLETKLQELGDFTTDAVTKLPATAIAGRPRTPKPEAALERLLDASDPDELKKAILHYEILGKPLSLRDPGGQIIGL